MSEICSGKYVGTQTDLAVHPCKQYFYFQKREKKLSHCLCTCTLQHDFRHRSLVTRQYFIRDRKISVLIVLFFFIIITNSSLRRHCPKVGASWQPQVGLRK